MNHVRIILQIRLSSSRLPAKALLPVADGLPSAVLAAKRAGNTNHSVTVATSDDPSDDILFQTLIHAGIHTVRGSLENVLERFLLALKDDPDDTTVVRLTGDNLLVDGEFIDRMLSEFYRTGAKYMGGSGVENGLPYGMGTELFYAGDLRHAARNADAVMREHVTTPLRYGCAKQPDRAALTASLPDLRALRCTMDTFHDYLKITELFAGEPDPIHVSWEVLCKRLAAREMKCPQVPRSARHSGISALTLGGAQLGIDSYGIANRTRHVEKETVLNCLKTAVSSDVRQVDCARAYGNAERNVGEVWKKIDADNLLFLTKLDPLAGIPDDAPAEWIRSAVDASIFRSLTESGMTSLPFVLLHRWTHRHFAGDAVWNRLTYWRAEKRIGSLGASVQTVEEGLEALRDPEIKALQLPFNLLDSRWFDIEFQKLANERTDVVIYTRSAFLQGALLLEPDQWAMNCRAYARTAIPVIDELVKKLHRKDRRDLCLAYVRGQRWIDSLVMGVDSAEQLAENIRYLQEKPLNGKEIEIVRTNLPEVPAEVVNPALWRNE